MNYNTFNKKEFQESIENNVKRLYRRTVEEATQQQLFQAVSYAVKDAIIDKWIATQEQYEKDDPKTVYYMSMEFLMGRALGNNIINMTAYKDVAEALDEMGINLNVIEDEEPDAALGNGGLGRLAACFLDSLATLGYAAYGCGIRYRYGMFKQKIRDGYQIETPDDWLKDGNPFEVRRDEYAKEVRFGGTIRVQFNPETKRNEFIQENFESVLAIPYDMPIVGYRNNVVNTLRIWDAKAITDFHLAAFDRGEYQKAVEQENLAKTIVEVLYPNDNHYAGKELRLKQQYFFISASLQEAVEKYLRDHDDIKKFHEKVTIQMNDTHPTVAVAELMRLLMDEQGLEWDEAWEVTTKTCAYTNHTIMAEALEKWPIDLFSRLLPRVYQIVEEINRRFVEQIRKTYPGNEEKVRKMAILYDGQVKMAHLAIVAGYSVNGVAKLHTEILKNEELKDFYEMMPEKFNNKTNGITQRRFLLHGNPLLADWVTKQIGDGWITDLSQMAKLKPLADDLKARKEFMDIKFKNKERLAKYILEHNGVEVDPRSIFDVQVKRLHEYKRQLLNILHVMYLYNQIKEHPEMPFYSRTFIFGAKASAGYKRAKQIIKLINSVAEVINNDRSINGKLKVVFIEDYRVSNAEWIFAAADVSEQISTASKEASGTGNMKFMLNGAPTLGTMDGANVEIVEEVGIENAFIFGLSSDEVINYENNGGYNPVDIYFNDWEVKRVVDQLVDGTYAHGDREMYRDLYNSLLNTNSSDRADTYFILKDFRSYAEAQQRVETAYRDTEGWARMALLNTASCGKFTSDRTIQQYVDEIWKLDKVTVENVGEKSMNMVNHAVNSVAVTFVIIYLLVAGVMLIGAVINYIVRGVGMYRIGKAQGKTNAWFAFVPFVRTYFQGELGGNILLKNKMIKNPGIWMLLIPVIQGIVTGIMSVVCWAALLIGTLGMGYYDVRSGIEQEMASGGNMFSTFVVFVCIFGAITTAFTAASKVLRLLVNRQIYENYTSSNMAVTHAFLGTMIPLYESVCLFIFGRKAENESQTAYTDSYTDETMYETVYRNTDMYRTAQTAVPKEVTEEPASENVPEKTEAETMPLEGVSEAAETAPEEQKEDTAE